MKVRLYLILEKVNILISNHESCSTDLLYTEKNPISLCELYVFSLRPLRELLGVL